MSTFNPKTAQESQTTSGKPHGQPLRWGSAGVQSMSRIGPEDIASARAMWRRCVQRKLRNLIDAGRVRR